MTKQNSGTKRRWAVVLAGGEGSRMKPFIQSWLGRQRPKQYCSFTGEKSMLEHAWERAQDVVAPGRILTVIGRGHSRFLSERQRLAVPGRVIEQPENRETAPGIYLPLAYALAEDPEAVVTVLPSDHFVRSRERFAANLEAAFALAERLENKAVLLAAEPERAEPDYGWIEADGRPVTAAALSARAVRRFHEKPEADVAEDFLAQGFLWNTMIMAAKAKTLWSMGRRLYPGMMRRFDALRLSVQAGRETSVLREIYRGMEEVNFSRGILERLPEEAVVLPLRGVDWCDWGRPERVVETLERIGKAPNFPAVLVRPHAQIDGNLVKYTRRDPLQSAPMASLPC